MELRPIVKSGDYVPEEEVRKVLNRRFIIACVIVLVGGIIIWMIIKNL